MIASMHLATTRLRRSAVAAVVRKAAPSISTMPEAPSSQSSVAPATLVMQLIIDKTLLEQPGWSMGPMMAQAAHATSAILSQTYTEANTQAYLSPDNLPHMRKVVLTTQAGASLRELSDQLHAARNKAEPTSATASTRPSDTFPQHHLWIEQPENIATVLAIAPNSRPSSLKKVLSKCVLLRS